MRGAEATMNDAGREILTEPEQIFRKLSPQSSGMEEQKNRISFAMAVVSLTFL